MNKNYYTKKDGELTSITKDVELDPKWKSAQEAEGFTILEIPTAIENEDPESYELNGDGNLVVNPQKKIKEQRRRVSERRSRLLPTFERFMVAYYKKEQGDSGAMDNLITKIADALAQEPEV